MKPIACDLEALTESENRLRQECFEILEAAKVTEKRTKRGVRWTVRSTRETIQAAGTFIVLESRCCPFLGFRLEISPSADSLTLTLTGPEGIHEFLGREMKKPE